MVSAVRERRGTAYGFCGTKAGTDVWSHDAQFSSHPAHLIAIAIVDCRLFSGPSPSRDWITSARNSKKWLRRFLVNLPQGCCKISCNFFTLWCHRRLMQLPRFLFSPQPKGNSEGRYVKGELLFGCHFQSRWKQSRWKHLLRLSAAPTHPPEVCCACINWGINSKHFNCLNQLCQFEHLRVLKSLVPWVVVG